MTGAHMIRAHKRAAAGEAADLAPPLSVRLGYDDRHRRRFAVTATTGERILIDLAEAERLRGGDRLLLEDGRVLLVEAEAEAVVDITAPDAALLTKIAWHLGNRHTPTAVLDGRLRIRRDHVLEAMVVRLGGTAERTEAPFDPEVGAYHQDAGAGGGHSHSHSHAHSHSHGRDHDDDDDRFGAGHRARHEHEGGHHGHRVAAAGDGAGRTELAEPAAAVLSNADEREA